MVGCLGVLDWCLCPGYRSTMIRVDGALRGREAAFDEHGGMTIEAIRRRRGDEEALRVSRRRIDSEHRLVCAIIALMENTRQLCKARSRCKTLDDACRDAFAISRADTGPTGLVHKVNSIDDAAEYVSRRLRFALKAAGRGGPAWTIRV